MKNRVTKTERLSVRVSPDLRKRLKAVTEAQDRTESWVVEKCLVKILPELEKQKPSFNQPELQLAGYLIAA